MFYPSFTQPQQFFAAWQRLMGEHVTRLEALNEQIASAEQQGYERTAETIDEAAKLMKASLEHAQTLASQWRKQTLEATKQMSSLGGAGS